MRLEARRLPALVLVLLVVGGEASLPAAPSGAAIGTHRAAGKASGVNTARAMAQHYVVLLSLDGFRADYTQNDGALHLLALGRQGVSAPEGMLPSYPALGLPNQFTIVTGLFPGHHGLVADNFYDPERKARFFAENPKDREDGSWFAGIPLWSLAEAQGMRSAVIDWPGSEAEIAGFRPTYNLRNRHCAEARECTQQILRWLRLPAAERPHFIAVNLSEPGSTAWRYGPDALETKKAVLMADDLVGEVEAQLESTRLPVDLVVVSDRGLAKPDGGWITLDQFASLNGFVTVGPLLYGETEEQREHLYRQINHVSSLFVVYRRQDLPPELHMRHNPRIGDPVVLATGAYAIRATAPQPGHLKAPPSAVDGLDPQTEPQMRAIFFAAGPDILPGKTLGPFENVNLYPWIAHMLGLKPPKSDGSLNILAGTLRDDGDDPPGAANE